MAYEIVWSEAAEQELAAVWIAAPDRSAVTRAAHTVEQRLRSSPGEEGEDRPNGRRVTFEPPLVVVFEVDEAAATVRVLNVRSPQRRRGRGS